MGKIDIILPCYNPAKGWAADVIDGFLQLKKDLNSDDIGLILVNDGSDSGINKSDIDLLKSKIDLFSFLYYDSNQGKGYAIRYGVKSSNADLIIYTDIDFPYTRESLNDISQSLKSGECDIAVGVRNMDYYEKVPLWRSWISKSFRYVLRNFLNLKVTDTQAGLKGFNKKGRDSFLKTSVNRYLFDLEFIYLASKNNELRLKPIIIELRDGIEFSRMNPSILLKELKNFLKIILRGH